MDWSPEQLKGITESGHNILVNAGAGSGKTAVLTERLVQLINKGVKIDELIVLTFTNLAAAEMKERLRKELKKNHTESAKVALEKIDVANIQTFDAFINEFIKKYHYLLNINKEFTMVESVVFQKVKQDIIDEIFDELYEQKNEQFKIYLQTYTFDDDKKNKKLILQIYDKLIKDVNYKDVLKNIEDEFTEEHIQKIIDDHFKLIKEIVETMGSYCDELSTYTSAPQLYDKYQKIVDFIDDLYNTTSYDDIAEIINNPFPNLRGLNNVDDEEKSNFSRIHGIIKNSFSKIKELAIYESTEYMKEEYLKTKENTLFLANILSELDNRLYEYKKQHNAYSFDDLAQMAIQILKENEDIRLSIKNHTYEILIDEYQDTSDIQEKLINLIENNNVYMVGDVKQSIYRFRNANPNLFREKFNTLKSTGGVINFTKNFRSRKNVLDPVNLIFSKLMSEDIGGVTYNSDHKLNYGQTRYDEFDDGSYDMKIYTYEGENQVIDDQKYRKEEVEAFTICQKIKEMLKNGKMVFDKDKEEEGKKGVFRKVGYGDIAIIASTKTNFDTYKKIFESQGIPLQIIKDDEISNSFEIYALNSLLKLICYFYDCKNHYNDFKYALTSFLRSFLYQINDDLIYEIVRSNNIKEELEKKIPSLYEQLAAFNKKMHNLSLKEFIIDIYKEFNFFEKILVLEDVNASEQKLMYILDIIDNLNLLGYQLEDVIEFIDLLKEDGFEYQIKNDHTFSKTAVKMLTIHASKGLEFPICFFPDLSKEFNSKELSDLILYSKTNHFIIPFINEYIKTSNPKKFFEEFIFTKEEKGEEIRKLYVALTRAKEQIILILDTSKSKNSTENDYILNETNKEKAQSYKKLLLLIEDYLRPYMEPIDLNNIGLNKDYDTNKENKTYNPIFKDKLKFSDISVKKEEHYQSRASKDTQIISSAERKLMDIGTKFHKALELSQMDFNIVDTIQYDKGIKDHIKAFLNNEFIKNLNIIKHYHEYAFSYEKEKKEINGIMDLLLETNDAFYIIDYKLSNIDDEAYQKQLCVYEEYLQTITTKPIYKYLYSIIKNEFKKV